MGIPSFSRWLYQKYPKTIVPVVDHAILSPEGKIVLPDTTEPNPNKTEFDNLYIDMNGLIHPCCHPEDGPAPKDEDAMLENINDYFLYIFSLVRPRKILYLALDGVAPRAKMNQQRSRRFLSDKERNDERALNQRIAEKWKQDGRRIPENALKTSWDHNVITPGTPFMQKVSRSLKKLIRKLLAEDRSWKNLKVLYSDSSVPGEGEHKIMQFIRTVRLTPGYDPNSRHCVHGLDADLFMLALATHEPHFSLLRESVISPSVKSFESVSCEHCGSKSHATENCHVNKALRKNPKASISPKKFQFAHIWILREYLSEELRVQSFEGWDLERAVDDFVFLCFFVGNDFLPHLPSLSIREGSIDLLMSLYTKEFAEIGYLTSHGDINFRGVSFLLSKIGQLEDAVFKKRIEVKILAI